MDCWKLVTSTRVNITKKKLDELDTKVKLNLFIVVQFLHEIFIYLLISFDFCGLNNKYCIELFLFEYTMSR